MLPPVMSNLAKSVFDQTPCPFNVDWAWWVEQRLQKMKINGLVKMINQSKKIDQNYIDGYMPKFKWAYRENPIDISGCDWFFGIIQNLKGGEFNWFLWEKIVKIPESDIDLVHQAMLKSVNRFNTNLSYILAIYEYDREDLEQRVKESMPNYSHIDIDNAQYTVSDNIKKNWDYIKGKL